MTEADFSQNMPLNEGKQQKISVVLHASLV
jgi:hypothetical protein